MFCERVSNLSCQGETAAHSWLDAAGVQAWGAPCHRPPTPLPSCPWEWVLRVA